MQCSLTTPPRGARSVDRVVSGVRLPQIYPARPEATGRDDLAEVGAEYGKFRKFPWRRWRDPIAQQEDVATRVYHAIAGVKNEERSTGYSGPISSSYQTVVISVPLGSLYSALEKKRSNSPPVYAPSRAPGHGSDRGC